ncbi:hypothetical protein IAR50_004216 [Cryptococcus sp. DSM 104548]
MTLTASALNHVVAIPAAFWGHMRHMFNLLLSLLKAHPNLLITVFLTPSVSSHMLVDLQSFLLKESQNETGAGSSRIQIITCGEQQPTEDTFVTPDFTKEVENYARILPAFVGGIIFDMCQTYFPVELRKIAKVPNIPVPPLLILTLLSLSSLYHLSIEGGDGRYGRVIRAVEKDVSEGGDIVEAYRVRPWEFNGSVATSPDLLSKFDYECCTPLMITQDTPAQATMGFFPCHGAIHDKDVIGIVVPFVQELEPKATATLEEQLGKSIYAVGP